jgi:hypothetical protein
MFCIRTKNARTRRNRISHRFDKLCYSSKWCELNSHQFTVIQADVDYIVNFQKFNSIHFFWVTVIFLWILIKLTLRKILILLDNLLDDEIYKRIKEKFQQCSNLCSNSSASKHIDHEFYVSHLIILSFYYNQSEHHFIFLSTYDVVLIRQVIIMQR